MALCILELNSNEVNGTKPSPFIHSFMWMRSSLVTDSHRNPLIIWHLNVIRWFGYSMHINGNPLNTPLSRPIMVDVTIKLHWITIHTKTIMYKCFVFKTVRFFIFNIMNRLYMQNIRKINVKNHIHWGPSKKSVSVQYTFQYEIHVCEK